MLGYARPAIMLRPVRLRNERSTEGEAGILDEMNVAGALEERPLAMASAPAEGLLARLAARTARVGIVGIGYVGLSLMIAVGEAGYAVRGIDSSDERVRRVAAGETGIVHLADERLARLIDGGRAIVSTRYEALADCDVIVVCVPTPLTRHREPDLSHIVAAAEGIADILRPGRLVILESTTYPGTTREVLVPILERSGLASGVEFFVGYSPEREDPGNMRFATTAIPKVVAGEGAVAQRAVAAFYGAVFDRVVPVSTTAAAEATKLLENVFRSVNIALVNELKLVFGRMGIDIWEVIEAARSKPFGFMPFQPGPGLGGHCVPIDPFYLTWKAREYGIHTRFIELAGEINSAMPQHVTNAVARALNDARKSVAGSCILIVGVAYKKNIADLRESPAMAVWAGLEALGASVDYFDPHVPAIEDALYPRQRGRRSVAWVPAALAGYDALVIATDHDGVDYDAIGRHAVLTIDTRNAMAGRQVTGAVVAA